MKMNGKLYKGSLIISNTSCVVQENFGGYQDKLEALLVMVSHDLGTPVPMWLSKNTKEYVRFKRTIFGADQFFEDVFFDRMEIRVEE